MKLKTAVTTLLLLSGIILSNHSHAQTTSKDGKSVIFVTTGSQARAHVEPLDALLVINRIGDSVEEIDVISSGYNARVVQDRVPMTGNQIGQFKIYGHPDGTATLSFFDITLPTQASEGRQKNRRVEMTIEFD